MAGVNLWTPIGPDGGSINALAASPAQRGLLYAGSSYGSGLFRSEDGGGSWVRVSRGLDVFVTAVIADPQAPGIVYVRANSRLWKSHDAGATWTEAPAPARQVGIESLAIDPRTPAILYAGTTSGVWKSANRGATWTRLPAGDGDFGPIAVDPSSPSTVYVVSGGRLLRSADSGATWAERDAGLPLREADCCTPVQLAVDPASVPGTVYVAFVSFGVALNFRSADAGGSWTQAAPDGYPLAVGQGVVYAGAVKSTDGGATWTAAAAAPGEVLVLAAAPGSATTLYAGTLRRGVVKSDDAAVTWQAASSGLFATSVVALAIDPLDHEVLYASVARAAQGPGVLKSSNGGEQWQLLGWPPVTGELEQLVIDPVTPATLYAVAQYGIAKSTDAGNSWEALGEGVCFGAKQLAIDPVHPSTLYAVDVQSYGPQRCIFECLALKSTDGGKSWSCFGIAGWTIETIYVAPGTPSTLYAFASEISHDEVLFGLFRSADAGLTWKRIDAGLHTNGGQYAFLLSLAIDPTDANRVFASVVRGVFRTTDGGKSWVEADRKLPLNGLGGVSARILAIDPHAPANVYATGDFGVYRSANGGQTWQPIVAGLPPYAFFSTGPSTGVLVLDPQQPGKLYAGTIVASIYTYTVR
ncbi:MAG TPA: hypothetical protein VE075_02515 [Thermoanaerobaculia bacterium]|nr:hypothetical protein [Thermoanaerobaculia bacterium]